MKKLFLLGVLVTAMCSQVFAYASIYNSITANDDIITFSSNVKDVQLFLNGNKVGIVNGQFKYYFQKRDGQDKVFTFKKEGYKTQEFKVTTKYSSVFFLNALTPFSVGSTVDSIITKNAMKYTPNQYFIDLQKN